MTVQIVRSVVFKDKLHTVYRRKQSLGNTTGPELAGLVMGGFGLVVII
jgi:hypothetical protein